MTTLVSSKDISEAFPDKTYSQIYYNLLKLTIVPVGKEQDKKYPWINNNLFPADSIERLKKYYEAKNG